VVILMFRCQASFNSVVYGECDFDVGILYSRWQKYLIVQADCLEGNVE
jgi:hypothetical protein